MLLGTLKGKRLSLNQVSNSEFIFLELHFLVMGETQLSWNVMEEGQGDKETAM